MQYQTIKNIMIMNEQVFKPVENYVNDFKNHFINTLYILTILGKKKMKVLIYLISLRISLRII